MPNKSISKKVEFYDADETDPEERYVQDKICCDTGHEI